MPIRLFSLKIAFQFTYFDKINIKNPIFKYQSNRGI